MIWLYSFLFAGIMCAIGETIYQFTKLSPGHITSIYVIAGVFLESFNIYDFFIKNCGGGAYILITSFGHSLAHEAKLGALSKGIIGILENIFVPSSLSLTVILVLSFICSLIFKPKA